MESTWKVHGNYENLTFIFSLAELPNSLNYITSAIIFNELKKSSLDLSY